jgi:acyl-coenzyme A thioesterase PaaI-like protein
VKRAHFWDLPESLPDDAWRARRRLAAALRDLAALCVTTDADETALSEAAGAANAIKERLAAYPKRTFLEAFKESPDTDKPERADRIAFIGRSNPIAPPMTFWNEGELSIGTVTLGPAFEGAPGCVHGGIVAAAFDQLCGFVQVTKNTGSLTATLTIHYRRPTPIDTELRLEARLARVEGRKSWITATMHARGKLVAEAEGLFVALGDNQMTSIAETHARAENEG